MAQWLRVLAALVKGLSQFPKLSWQLQGIQFPLLALMDTEYTHGAHSSIQGKHSYT
jgi:membrane protein implicated in regulation of membrane protease activity